MEIFLRRLSPRALLLLLLTIIALAPAWSKYGSSQKEKMNEQRRRMVDEQIRRRGIEDTLVLRAMNKVPRHKFIPTESWGEAYEDHPVPIGYGQTISQPYIVALMTDLLHLTSESRVLEIGTGSGYQAAVLAEFTPHVYTIEIIKPLHENSARILAEMGLDSAHVRYGDGYYGLEEAAPFDAIIVTAAADHIPPPLIRQLRPGGCLVIPIGAVHATQELVIVSKDARGRVTTRSVLAVRFVPLTGGPRTAE